ncbi:MAG: hypothetical protein JST92_26730, partial [Deltaproteobacteria bacterium]|nr:hypothetical protein [Deltaproteobacteria bacterium]
MTSRMKLVLALCPALLVACTGTRIDNGDPRAPEIIGIVRTDTGAYQPGQVEHFRVEYATEVAPEIHWSASAGGITESGDEVAWTLPDAEEASLTVSLGLPKKITTTSFHFRIAGGANLNYAVAPSGVVDASKDVTGSACKLAFNSAGNPVIFYSNTTHPSVWLATWTGSAWATEQVDGMGYEVGGQPRLALSMQLAADGTPHLAYALGLGNGTSKAMYATKSGSAWIRERVDGPAYPYSTAGEPN